jgi:glutamate dehydrogenase/leucine dehydrogenase
VSTQRKTTLRMAAYVTAVARIVEAIKFRGFYP